MLSLSALHNMWKQASVPLGCVRTSKRGECMFGIYYGHSPQESGQRSALQPSHVCMLQISFLKEVFSGMYLSFGYLDYLCNPGSFECLKAKGTSNY